MDMATHLTHEASASAASPAAPSRSPSPIPTALVDTPPSPPPAKSVGAIHTHTQHHNHTCKPHKPAHPPRPAPYRPKLEFARAPCRPSLSFLPSGGTSPASASASTTQSPLTPESPGESSRRGRGRSTRFSLLRRGKGGRERNGKRGWQGGLVRRFVCTPFYFFYPLFGSPLVFLCPLCAGSDGKGANEGI